MRPLEQTRRALSIGAAWQDPPPAPGAPRGIEDGEDRFASAGDADYLAAIEASYAPREAQNEADELSRGIARALRKEKKLAERRLDRIERELLEADEANDLQRRGELLKGVLGQIKPGDTEVRARDYASGQEVAIPLDPSKSPKANMEAAFKKYQKLVRRLAKAGGQVERAKQRVRSRQGGPDSGWRAATLHRARRSDD